jgi:type IV pilus assembly protein PilM
MPLITLEISQTEIKLMEITGKRVVKWGNQSLDSNLFEEGVISNVQALSDALKQLMASSGIRGGNFAVSISGLYSLSRIILVPNPPGGPTTQMVWDAAQEVIPLSEEESYISWQPVATIEGGQQVLVLGVPRDVVDNQMQALRLAGVNPRVLDLKAMALVRAVNRAQALILNIETTSFDIVIVAGGIPAAMRTTAWQPDNLTLEGRAEQLAIALELAVGFHHSQHAALPLEPGTPLFITGQMSGDTRLIERLEARLSYKVEPFVPPVDYPSQLPVAQYAANIGLALKGAAAPKRALEEGEYPLPDVNLLPDAYKPWKPSARQMQSFAALIAAVALLFPLYQIATGSLGETAILKAEYTMVNSELSITWLRN